jgi:hypothetical protein
VVVLRDFLVTRLFFAVLATFETFAVCLARAGVDLCMPGRFCVFFCGWEERKEIWEKK